MRNWFFGLLFVLVATVAFGGADFGVPATDSSVSFFENISVSQAVVLLEQWGTSPNLVILDVRSESEFRNGHLVGALQINVLENDFCDRVSQLDSRKTFLVYCHAGSRSKKAMLLMKGLGFLRVYNMEGGFSNWKAKGYDFVQ